MEPVTSQDGRKGFYDESIGFISVDSMEKVTDPNGVRGYFTEKSGFIPEPSVNDTNIPQEEWATDKSPQQRMVGDSVDMRDMPKPKGSLLSRIGNYAKEGVLGVPEAALSLGTGAIGSMGGLVAGNLTAAYQGLKGNPNWGESAKQVQNATRDIMTYQPTTKSGQALAELTGKAVSVPFTGVQKGLSLAGKAAVTPFIGEWPTQEKYPNLTYTIDSAAEAGALGLAPRATSKLGEVVKGEVTPSQALAATKNITNAVIDGVKKGISPGVNKMRSKSQMDNYFKDAETVAKDIVANKDSIDLTNAKGELLPAGTVPKTNHQFMEAIDQNKIRVFKEYDAMKNEAGETASVQLSGVAEELKNFANAPGMAENPRMSGIRNQALEYADNLEKKGSYSLTEAQDIIQSANSRLKAFYKNPSFETATPAAMEHIVASNLRKSLGETIENEVGPGYTELRNKYKAYKTIESDVAHRATVSQRAKPFGFFDYGNILTGVEAATALLTLSPVHAAKAGVIYGIKKQMQRMNQPDYHIQKMFNTVDKEMGKTAFDLSQDPNLPPVGKYDPWQRDIFGPDWASPPPELLEYNPNITTAPGIVQSGINLRPSEMVNTTEGRFRPGVSSPPIENIVGGEAVDLRGPANFFQGTIPPTSYAPGTPRPDLKTYWVNEAAKRKAAEEMRRKYNR